MVAALVKQSARDKFVKSYEGDIIVAAYAAGVTLDQARQWLRQETVKKALVKRGVLDPRLYRDIATEVDTKIFWSRVMWDTREEMLYRLKASELHGKALGVFIERRQITGADGGPIQTQNLNIGADMPVAELEERVRKLKERGVSGSLEEEILG